MRHPRPTPGARCGVTLLEVMTALSLSATMMASSFVVMRSSYAAWQAHEADLESAVNATAVLRHLTRQVRQAVGVAAISTPGDSSGHLAVFTQAGSTLRWDHSGTGVTLSEDSATPQPLADDILTLSFEGYLADGVTATSQPNEVHAIRVVVTTQQPGGGSRTISSFAWVRSW